MASPESDSAPRWKGPLFVTGLWRSGTSLLYALLNKHPQIGLLYEGDLYLLRPLFWVPGARRRWLARWNFWNEAPTRHGLDVERIQIDDARLSAAMEKAYQEYARQKGALIWGEKSVHFQQSFERLLDDFPEARFIFLWRDLTAVCTSVMRAEDNSYFGQRGMIDRTLGRFQIMKAQCNRLIRDGVPVHQIHYETLTKDPASVMAEVCSFLGVPFLPEVASLSGADRSAIYEGEHHSLVKSERIVSPTQRSQVLPAKVRRKIERYKSLEKSGDTRSMFPPTESTDSQKPSLRERLFDRALYRCLRTYDAVVILIYCYAPFWLLKRYRTYRHPVQTNS